MADVQTISIIVAVISLVGSITATLITVWSNWLTDIHKRRSETSKLVAKYHDPLLRAAQDLQSRLYNMTQDKNIFHRMETKQQRDDNLIAYTCFLIGQFCAWVCILRRQGQFVQFSTDGDYKEFVNALDAIHEAFSDNEPPLEKHPFCLWRNQQLGIGEVMTVKEDGGELVCMSYATFTRKKADNDSDMHWFKTLEEDINMLASHHQKKQNGETTEILDQRLRILQHLLVKLIRMLDPKKLRSDSTRGNLVAAESCRCDQGDCSAGKVRERETV